MKSNGSQIQTGIFKRLISYITTKNYERKKFANENYKINWDKIKWRYRIGKILFLFGFYYTGKYFFVDRIINNTFISQEISKERETIINLLERGLDQESLDYKNILNKIRSNNSNFFKIELFENFEESEENLQNNKESLLIYKLTEDLLNKFKSDEYTNLIDQQQQPIQNIDLKSVLKVLKIRKKYDPKNLDLDYVEVINFAEMNYKYLLTGSFIPKKVLQFSANSFEEFNNIEEVAFLISMNLYDFLNAGNINKKVFEEVLTFLDETIEINKQLKFFPYNEDLKLIRKDLAVDKNISTVIYLFIYM